PHSGKLAQRQARSLKAFVYRRTLRGMKRGGILPGRYSRQRANCIVADDEQGGPIGDSMVGAESERVAKRVENGQQLKRWFTKRIETLIPPFRNGFSCVNVRNAQHLFQLALTSPR